jgi:hypothetical protein
MKAQQTRLRGLAVGTAIVLGIGGLGACSNSEGPEAGAVTTSDLQGLEEQLGGLEERVGTLEEGGGVAAGEMLRSVRTRTTRPCSAARRSR